jgi:hypothetical protein
MRAKWLGFYFFAFATAAYPQALDLKGRVVQADGSPIPQASVLLMHRGTSAKTGADGSFALDGNSAVAPVRGRAFDFRLHPDFLEVEVRIPVEMRIEVFDGAGRGTGGLTRALGEGRHRIDLAGAMSAAGRKPGLYFLRLNGDGRTFTQPFFHSGSGLGAVFAPADPGGPAAKRAADADSLRISKTGYGDRVVPITSYTAGQLGDLVLTPEAGGICARQSLGRTSDGFDVVNCEALYDQPPRAHLPIPAASSAYAALSGDSFTTLAGQSYPYPAVPGSGDPEVRRHASALYEIKILNGKVESFRPAVVFAESLFVAPLMGKSFEGMISKKSGTGGRYEYDPSLPVRVRILSERFQAELNDGMDYELKVSILNLTGAITAADGSCLPGLATYGAQAPFASGSDVLLTVGRVPSMHAFGDDEMVFAYYIGGVPSGSVMSRTWFFSPLDLIKATPALSGAYLGIGHGAPGSIPSLRLGPASAGGEACASK